MARPQPFMSNQKSCQPVPLIEFILYKINYYLKAVYVCDLHLMRARTHTHTHDHIHVLHLFEHTQLSMINYFKSITLLQTKHDMLHDSYSFTITDLSYKNNISYINNKHKTSLLTVILQYGFSGLHNPVWDQFKIAEPCACV